jgi:hypothetical protein
MRARVVLLPTNGTIRNELEVSITSEKPASTTDFQLIVAAICKYKKVVSRGFQQLQYCIFHCFESFYSLSLAPFHSIFTMRSIFRMLAAVATIASTSTEVFAGPVSIAAVIPPRFSVDLATRATVNAADAADANGTCTFKSHSGSHGHVVPRVSSEYCSSSVQVLSRALPKAYDLMHKLSQDNSMASYGIVNGVDDRLEPLMKPFKKSLRYYKQHENENSEGRRKGCHALRKVNEMLPKVIRVLKRMKSELPPGSYYYYIDEARGLHRQIGGAKEGYQDFVNQVCPESQGNR